MSNKTLFGSASSTIIAGFNAIETIAQAVNTTAQACNNLADVALITSEGYKQSAILRQKKELADLGLELQQEPEQTQEQEEEQK